MKWYCSPDDQSTACSLTGFLGSSDEIIPWVSIQPEDAPYDLGGDPFPLGQVECLSSLSDNPTTVPTNDPSTAPTNPTNNPSHDPTNDPTNDPTHNPSYTPTIITSQPTSDPTISPTFDPTSNPTVTSNPTNNPTDDPSNAPTALTNSPTTSQPSVDPTDRPSTSPTTSRPTFNPTNSPTMVTSQPTFNPTSDPTRNPTGLAVVNCEQGQRCECTSNSQCIFDCEKDYKCADSMLSTVYDGQNITIKCIGFAACRGLMGNLSLVASVEWLCQGENACENAYLSQCAPVDIDGNARCLLRCDGSEDEFSCGKDPWSLIGSKHDCIGYCEDINSTFLTPDPPKHLQSLQLDPITI